MFAAKWFWPIICQPVGLQTRVKSLALLALMFTSKIVIIRACIEIASSKLKCWCIDISPPFLKRRCFMHRGRARRGRRARKALNCGYLGWFVYKN
jgi:hypothetical protein